MEIREATAQDDDIFVRHYLAGWATENWPEEQYYPDAAARVRRFIQRKREGDGVGVSFSFAMDGKEVAGTVGYHLDSTPPPGDPAGPRPSCLCSIILSSPPIGARGWPSA